MRSVKTDFFQFDVVRSASSPDLETETLEGDVAPPGEMGDGEALRAVEDWG